jgi:hypothetical protein
MVEAKMVSLNALLFIPFFIAVIFLITALLQWLWNITIPEVFNLRPITFWQALRLILIAGILFGGPNFIG